ncbi:MAG TPA: hypothetical protein PKZ42_14430 [Syntrophales bacterium]|nr:hypothetical protein [Syntrophales bacterium]
MQRTIKIGIIGDYDPNLRYHSATEEALNHAAKKLSVSLILSWVPTLSLTHDTITKTLKPFHGLWCAPGSPYQSMDGALAAIRFAREDARPFIGTCGGFQHVLLEYARNVLDIEGAEHEETEPNAPTLLVSRLTCSLVGKAQTIKILPDSLLHKAYNNNEATEQFACSYGLNPLYRRQFEKSRLRMTGVDVNGEVRVVEIPDHPFYVATLFVPQVSSQPDNPHPLIIAYLEAAITFQGKAGK